MHMFSDMKHAYCSPARSRYATWTLAPPSSGPAHICAKRCSVIASARSSILRRHEPMESMLQPSSDATDTSRIILRALAQADRKHVSADAVGRASAAESPQVPFFDGCMASQGLQLRRPPSAHRSPVWPRWVWRSGRVERAAQCVFQQQVLRDARVTVDGRMSAYLSRICDRVVYVTSSSPEDHTICFRKLFMSTFQIANDTGP